MPWYREGLRFECTGCGKCCTGAPGFVWVTIEEMEAIAKFLDIPFKTFTQKFVKKVKNRYSLIEKGSHFDCVFFKEKKCTIYPVRPKQCQSYPFWPANLKSEAAWAACKQACEGISDQAPLVNLKSIRKKYDHSDPS